MNPAGQHAGLSRGSPGKTPESDKCAYCRVGERLIAIREKGLSQLVNAGRLIHGEVDQSSHGGEVSERLVEDLLRVVVYRLNASIGQEISESLKSPLISRSGVESVYGDLRQDLGRSSSASGVIGTLRKSAGEDLEFRVLLAGQLSSKAECMRRFSEAGAGADHLNPVWGDA